MMIIMQFTFQIILLAVGFSVGYWLLIKANEQQATMKTIGQTLGGILIVMAMILAIFSCYYSMKIANKGYMQGGCPIQKMVQQQENPTMENESTENPDSEKNETTMNQQNENQGQQSQEETSDTEGRPIKSNIKDHE